MTLYPSKSVFSISKFSIFCFILNLWEYILDFKGNWTCPVIFKDGNSEEQGGELRYNLLSIYNTVLTCPKCPSSLEFLVKRLQETQKVKLRWLHVCLFLDV